MVADLEARVRNVMRYEGIDEKAAREMVERADRERHAFIEKVFHVDPNACHHFDLVLNTDNYDHERLVDVALAALEARGTFRH